MSMPKNIWEIISVKGLLNIVKLVKVFKIKKRDSKKKPNKKKPTKKNQYYLQCKANLCVLNVSKLYCKF